MIREVKSITLGSGYDFIDLEKYTNNKDSINIKFEDTNEIFTKWNLDDFGLITIELGVLDYNKYENPHRINVIVEYEPSELPLSIEDIDTIEGLKRNVTDLKSLDYVCEIRLAAHRKFNITLNEFIAFNSMYFDTFGQVMKLEYDNIEKYDYVFPNFVTLADFKERIKRFSRSSGYIPSAESICPHCKQKWTLDNLKDCVGQRDEVYHIYCNKVDLYERAKTKFNYVASCVFNNYFLHAVKNEYGSQEYRGCWFIIYTDDGDIKIGWRKRVIQIEWLQNYKNFRFDGTDEEVTKNFSNDKRYIHADNVQKAIEYLEKAKRTIIK